MNRRAGKFLCDREYHAQVVASDTTSKAAAHERQVNMNVLGLNTRFFGRDRQCLHDCGDGVPQLDAIARHDRGSIQRLHRRVFTERREVSRLDELASGLIESARVARGFHLFLSGFVQAFEHGVIDLLCALPSRAFAVVPFDRHRL